MERSHWVAVRPGVYAVAGMPPTREQALLAVALAVRQPVAISHRSAGALWTMKGIEEPDRIEVVTDLGHWARLEVVDLSGSLSLAELGRCLDHSLRHGLSLAALRRCAGRLPAGPGRRMRLVHALLGERLPGYDPGDSDLETRVLRVLVTGGLPVPRQQVPVKVGRRRFKLDLAYPDLRIGIELDGWDYQPDLHRIPWRPRTRRLVGISRLGSHSLQRPDGGCGDRGCRHRPQKQVCTRRRGVTPVE
ncbi:MAG TPA: hypothetical protein VK988_02675 [Acidimicrobiales bacterium]|nr:hypothetical protein [Acidimicrobiales bacterium]